MTLALLILVALFALLLAGRIGAARRTELNRWPALVLAGAAIFMLARGAVWPATALALCAVVAWQLWPQWIARRIASAKKSASDPADVQARAILGVGPEATPTEIRAAYRAKMVRAHPDRGGTHAEAARLTAARDRLLGKRR
jgi:hypothetical protein